MIEAEAPRGGLPSESGDKIQRQQQGYELLIANILPRRMSSAYLIRLRAALRRYHGEMRILLRGKTHTCVGYFVAGACTQQRAVREILCVLGTCKCVNANLTLAIGGPVA